MTVMNEQPHRGPACPPSGKDKRFILCFGFAWEGIVYTLRTQRNARIHLGIAIAVVLLSLWLGLSWTEWAIIALTIGIVFSAEMFNTVAEAAIDLVTAEYHPLAKIAKDVAAGGVLVVAIISVVVGLLVLGPHLWQRVSALF